LPRNIAIVLKFSVMTKEEFEQLLQQHQENGMGIMTFLRQ
jgi:hypothetical protein